MKEGIAVPDVVSLIMPVDVVDIADIVDHVKNSAYYKVKLTVDDCSNVSLQTTLAKQAIAENRVFLQPQASLFIVVGSKGDHYCVQLFPDQKCKCSASPSCYHIVACQIAIGYDRTPLKSKRTVKLTTLKKSRRKRGEKKSGGKVPKSYDIDVEPAADSKYKLRRATQGKYF